MPEARRLVVLNKIDLGVHEGWEALVGGFPSYCLLSTSYSSKIPSVFVSLKTGEGLDELRVALRALLGHEGAGVPRDEPLVTNVRHETLLRQAHDAMVRTVAALDDRGGDVSEELVLADVAEARHALEEVTGRRSTEDLLRRIFERFCIGK